MTKNELIAKIEINAKKLTELQKQFLEIDLKNNLLRYDLILTDAKRFETKEENFGTKKNPDLRQVKFMFFDEELKDDDNPDNNITIERKTPIEINGRKCNRHGNFIEPDQNTKPEYQHPNFK